MTSTATVTVEIDPHSDPITGRVMDGHRSRDFSGWLEFAAALRAAMNPDEVRAV